jgi:hypothetical protein
MIRTLTGSPRHYLDTHAAYWVDSGGGLSAAVEIRYGYRYSGEHHLGEQLVRIDPAQLTEEGFVRHLAKRLSRRAGVRQVAKGLYGRFGIQTLGSPSICRCISGEILAIS